jgi:hypothetical protein
MRCLKYWLMLLGFEVEMCLGDKTTLGVTSGTLAPGGKNKKKLNLY